MDKNFNIADKIEDLEKKIATPSRSTPLSNDDLDKKMKEKSKELNLENDPQTNAFIKFFSLCNVFASSADFRTQIQNLPEIVKELKKLLLKIKEEIKEYAGLATHFEELVTFFLKIVSETTYNLKKTQPHFKNSIRYLFTIKDVLEELNKENEIKTENDKRQEEFTALTISFGKLNEGIHNITREAEKSKIKLDELTNKLEKFKEDLKEKKNNKDAQIAFAKQIDELSFLDKMVTLITGGAFSAILFAVLIPAAPIGVILIGAATGPVLLAIAEIARRFWIKHNEKALGFLTEFIKLVTRLLDDNKSFHELMTIVEIESKKININVDYIMSSLQNKYLRKFVGEACQTTIFSSNEVITAIDEISNLNLETWAKESNILNFLSSENNEENTNYISAIAKVD